MHDNAHHHGSEACQQLLEDVDGVAIACSDCSLDLNQEGNDTLMQVWEEILQKIIPRLIRNLLRCFREIIQQDSSSWTSM